MIRSYSYNVSLWFLFEVVFADGSVAESMTIGSLYAEDCAREANQIGTRRPIVPVLSSMSHRRGYLKSSHGLLLG